MKSDSDELLAICTAIEHETGALYLYFSELFLDMPEIARMLRKMMVEKENHVLQLQLAAKLEQRYEVDAFKNIDQAQQLLNLVNGLQARAREYPPTWRNALKFAIELENKLSKFYADTALVFAEDSFNSVYMAMKSHDEDQVLAMTQYLDAPTDLTL